MKNLILFFSFLAPYSSLVVAQTTKHKIQIGQFSLEPLSESLNGITIAKTLNGVYYEQLLNKSFSLNFGAQYTNKLVDDVCRSCYDGFAGIGKFKETNILVGVRYNDLPNNRFLKSFFQCDLSYGKSTYQGTFGGGFTGIPQTINNEYQKIGAVARVGIDFFPIKNICITAMRSFKASLVRKTDMLRFSKTENKQAGWIPVEVRVGVAF